MYIILLQNSDISSVVVVFSGGFLSFSQLEFQFPNFYLPHFAPTTRESETLEHDDIILVLRILVLLEHEYIER